MPVRHGPRVCLRPELSERLASLGLNVSFERGQGDFLYYRDAQGDEVEILDLVGGYGSLLLGHNHPALVAEAQRLLLKNRPMHAQGSCRQGAERLARALCDRLKGDYCAIFANSGAEAVEAAMKHAILQTREHTFLALDHGFHGKTLGAIQLAGQEVHRSEFGLPGLKVVRIPPNDLQRLDAVFAKTPRLAGVIFEPIQSEGGVRPLTRHFAQRLASLCQARGVPLIADECQTGLGRTGRLLACERLGIKPDYIILSKILGGGLAKISATLICRDQYVSSFDWKHTSTYADDDYSCEIALKALELIDSAVLERCEQTGEKLLGGLHRLHERYPDVIAGVRGAGLLVGLQFRRLIQSPSLILRLTSIQEDLVYVIAAYLFHVHRIRVAPTLSDPLTLRIEPSALLDDASVARLLGALGDVCSRLQAGDAAGLTDCIVQSAQSNGGIVATEPERTFSPFDGTRHFDANGDTTVVRVAWLCHLVDADSMVQLDPSFRDYPLAAREEFVQRFHPWMNPVVMSAVDIRSRTGTCVRLYPIMLPVTSQCMRRWIDARRTDLLRQLVARGVAAARSLGCTVLSLGQYTSIGTRHGRDLGAHGIVLTSGNSYTAALVVDAIRRAYGRAGRDPGRSVLAVVGAGGNVGGACTAMLAPEFKQMLLVGSATPASRVRLDRLAQCYAHASISTDLSSLREADAVIVAVNTPEPIVRAEHLGSNTIVCDVSVPPGVRWSDGGFSDCQLIQGGIARLPYREDVAIFGFPLPTGHVYGCMAEGIVLGLEGECSMDFTGPLGRAHVEAIARSAKRHGFELAEMPARGVPDRECRKDSHACIA